jgi:SAM-dependent methyltransferase
MTVKFEIGMARIVEAWQKSPRLAVQVALDRIADFVEERRLGIRTAAHIPIEKLIADPKDNHDYTPTSIRALRKLFGQLEWERGREVLLDYGCGMGRAVAIASEYPFRRIAGIEISPALIKIAQRNAAAFRGRQQCRDITFWNGSAEQFPIPADASVLFFFNPFEGRVLTQVLARIQESMAANPRRLQIVYVNPVHISKLENQYPWLKPRARFSFEHECILYDSGPPTPSNGAPADSTQECDPTVCLMK